jgi:anti-sigma factor RsiW
MDHEVAAKTHAIERYLLGEMPTSERDAFEEHYFACAECAGEIRTASALMHDMKAALREFKTAPKSSPPGWLSWLRAPVLVPTFAALVLCVVTGYQNTVVLPDLKAPRSMTSALILDGATRGDVPAVRAGDPLRFKVAVDGVSAPRLYVELDTESGGRVRDGEVAAPPANQALDVFFPGHLAAGRYQFVAREGPGGRELARSAFEVVNR